MNIDLGGRIALVTGGAAGIGEAIARALAIEGCLVSIADRDGVAADRAAAALTAEGLQARSIEIDVGDPAAVAQAFERLRRTDGRLDILVNGAGILSSGPAVDVAVSEWERVVRVNLSSVLHCAKAAIPLMTAQRRGRIVNIASVAAMRGGGSLGNALYGASKAGVVALTMGLARELGPHGITVNAVAPAVAETAMTRSKLTAEMRQRITARIPFGPACRHLRHRRSGGISCLGSRRLHNRGSHPDRRRHLDDVSMIRKSLPAGLTRGWEPVFGKDHAQTEEQCVPTVPSAAHKAFDPT